MPVALENALEQRLNQLDRKLLQLFVSKRFFTRTRVHFEGAEIKIFVAS